MIAESPIMKGNSRKCFLATYTCKCSKTKASKGLQSGLPILSSMLQTLRCITRNVTAKEWTFSFARSRKRTICRRSLLERREVQVLRISVVMQKYVLRPRDSRFGRLYIGCSLITVRWNRAARRDYVTRENVRDLEERTQKDEHLKTYDIKEKERKI